MKKYILIWTDGYSINIATHKSLELAQSAMQTAYETAMPEENDESSAEMSSCDDRDAILYQNGDGVLVWKVIACE